MKKGTNGKLVNKYIGTSTTHNAEFVIRLKALGIQVTALWTASVFDDLHPHLNLTKQPKGSNTTPENMSCSLSMYPRPKNEKNMRAPSDGQLFNTTIDK